MNNVVSENNTVDISKILDDILKDENYKNDDESLFKCVFSRIEPKVIIKIEAGTIILVFRLVLRKV